MALSGRCLQSVSTTGQRNADPSLSSAAVRPAAAARRHAARRRRRGHRGGQAGGVLRLRLLPLLPVHAEVLYISTFYLFIYLYDTGQCAAWGIILFLLMLDVEALLFVDFVINFSKKLTSPCLGVVTSVSRLVRLALPSAESPAATTTSAAATSSAPTARYNIFLYFSFTFFQTFVFSVGGLGYLVESARGH